MPQPGSAGMLYHAAACSLTADRRGRAGQSSAVQSGLPRSEAALLVCPQGWRAGAAWRGGGSVMLTLRPGELLGTPCRK